MAEGLEPASGDGARFGGVNALRALAALSVVGFHVGLAHPALGVTLGGLILFNLNVGVTLFFVISGFLLFRPFVAALDGGRSVSIRQYGANRALRIAPLFAVACVVAYLVEPGVRHASVLLRSLTFTSAYSFARPASVIPVTWSVDDEVVFYLLLPVLFLLLARSIRAGRRAVAAAWTVAALCLLSFAVQTAFIVLTHTAHTGTRAAEVYLLNPASKFMIFGFGMLLALVHRRVSARLGGAAALALLVAAAMLVISGVSLHRLSPALDDALAGAGFALCLAAVVFSPPRSRLVRLLSLSPLAFLGELSYGVYLWHLPVLAVVARAHILPASFWLSLALVAGTTLVLSTLTYFVVERPALRLKRLWARPLAAVPSGAGGGEAAVAVP